MVVYLCKIVIHDGGLPLIIIVHDEVKDILTLYMPNRFRVR